MTRWEVLQEQSGLSLQAFLKSKLGDAFSAKSLKRAIDEGKCLLNGKRERFASRLVGSGDTIELSGFEEKKKNQNQTLDSPNRILYTDDVLVAYDKPPFIDSESPEIVEALKARLGSLILLHRLDKETTGVLLFARSEAAAKAIEALFRKRCVAKTYHAFADGIPSLSSGVVENFLGRRHACQGRAVWGAVSKEKGLRAKTAWEVISKGKDASLLACYPETGRTHQIRVHLSGIGHPLLGDRQYGQLFACRYSAPRILLHAAKISFEHPITGKMVVIEAPLPEDFIKASQDLLEKHG